MQYFGGKYKTRKQTAAFLEAVRKPGQIYFEPFVGGAWILQEMSGERIASDGNKALIAMYKALQAGWVPPSRVSAEEYQSVRVANNENDPMDAFCGIGCSFAGKLWGGYARSKKTRFYAQTTRDGLMKQLPKIKKVQFINGVFHDHKPVDMLIYCDPPYQGRTRYRGFLDFDHDFFWRVMRKWSKKNTVVISECRAPEDFKCVLEIPTLTSLRGRGGLVERRIERLFMCK